ncbi:MAG: hypothetical protein WCI50_12410, partial [Actinomycetes bacterium]
VDVTYEGRPGEFGKAAKVAIKANGREVASGKIPRTIPNAISLGEGLDVGTDTGSAIDFTYELPFTFTGAIDRVTVEIPALVVPALGAAGAWHWTATDVAPVDPYAAVP